MVKINCTDFSKPTMSAYLRKLFVFFQRLEEIMRRTRRTDSADTVRFTAQFLKVLWLWGLMTHIQPWTSPSPCLKATACSLLNGLIFVTQKSVSARILPNEARPKENTEPVQNGTIEEAVKLPVGSKPSQLGLNGVDDMVPVVAFKERRSLRTLAGLEEIQTHQRAGMSWVIFSVHRWSG